MFRPVKTVMVVPENNPERKKNPTFQAVDQKSSAL
jgi:hypothetical protein